MSKFLLFSILIILTTSTQFDSILLMSKKRKPSDNLSEYLKSTKNCPVTDTTIQKKAKSFSGNKKKKAEKIFHFVQYSISYERYSNTRYGAVKTLSLKKGNCCDQTHLLVALFRAAGIPARYVHGNDHWWTQPNVDGKWYDCDPTNKRHKFGKRIGDKRNYKPTYHVELDH